MSPSAVALCTERALVAINSSEARLTRTEVRESQSKPMPRGKPPATQNPVSRVSLGDPPLPHATGEDERSLKARGLSDIYQSPRRVCECSQVFTSLKSSSPSPARVYRKVCHRLVKGEVCPPEYGKKGPVGRPKGKCFGENG